MLVSQYLYVNVGVTRHAQAVPTAEREEGQAMVAQGLLAKATHAVVTGVVGVGTYELLRKALGSSPVHRATVTATEWSLRGTRRAEEAAESARLKFGDVVAEARERIGEEAPPPPMTETDAAHDH